MLTQVHRGESAPRVQGQYTSGLKPSQSSGMQGGQHGRNNRYTSNSVNTTNRMVRWFIWLSFFTPKHQFISALINCLAKRNFQILSSQQPNRYLKPELSNLSCLEKLFVDFLNILTDRFCRVCLLSRTMGSRTTARCCPGATTWSLVAHTGRMGSWVRSLNTYGDAKLSYSTQMKLLCIVSSIRFETQTTRSLQILMDVLQISMS